VRVEIADRTILFEAATLTPKLWVFASQMSVRRYVLRAFTKIMAEASRRIARLFLQPGCKLMLSRLNCPSQGMTFERFGEDRHWNPGSHSPTE
jgi:hypothetical protein